MQHFISLGAGVQSSTLALMATHGEVGPMPAGAIFADTQSEPAGVYRWLDWLEPRLAFPVHRVTAGNLRAAALTHHVSRSGMPSYFRTAIPFFMRAMDGLVGRITHRSCTRDYKIRPIMKAVRRLASVPRGTKAPVVCSWIGISLDEWQRMSPSRDPWCESRWPLIEKRMTRLACREWMTRNGYPQPPRSACTFCPFRSDEEWRLMKANDPDSFADAVAFDREARRVRSGQANLRSVPYIHRSCIPLDQVDFRNDTDKGQLLLWDEECSGMCGV